jgi:tRNA guanosine-2'-O-methyltransferase
MGGNWIVGRYKIDYFKKPDSGNDLHLRQVLAAVIPWLSSTQGFSRAIAQLLVYALIPLVTDVASPGGNVAVTDTDWFIRVIFKFLDENREMKRLRNKQTKFFEGYNVEDMCTVEGVLGISHDEGDEAAPEHLIDAMKVALKNVYDESHSSEYIPEWKQVEQILQSQQDGTGDDTPAAPEEGQNEVNFQRKIIPLDALNLAMEDLREKKLRNVAGQRKQQLIVCASLVDKVPNLGGLARTAEIFAADRLTIPDIGVTKMDNFKSISVGAGDWIDIEEVKEQVCTPFPEMSFLYCQ